MKILFRNRLKGRPLVSIHADNCEHLRSAKKGRDSVVNYDAGFIDEIKEEQGIIATRAPCLKKSKARPKKKAAPKPRAKKAKLARPKALPKPKNAKRVSVIVAGVFDKPKLAVKATDAIQKIERALSRMGAKADIGGEFRNRFSIQATLKRAQTPERFLRDLIDECEPFDLGDKGQIRLAIGIQHKEGTYQTLAHKDGKTLSEALAEYLDNEEYRAQFYSDEGE